MIAKNLAWLTPFIFFIIGFFAARSMLDAPYLPAPCVVGYTLPQAFTTLSNHNLSSRLSIQKIDTDLPDGTVLSQTPAAGQMVKPRQTIFLTLSKQPEKPLAPNCISKDSTTISRDSKKANIRLKKYEIESVYPAGSCIGQYPSPGSPIEGAMTAYIACQQAPLYIWPDFSDKSLEEVCSFLEQYNITPQSIDSGSAKRDSSPIVTGQRPLAGTLISISPNLRPIVQLYVQ